MDTLDWEALVQDRNAWIAHNFPDPKGNRTPLDSVLGCIEEVGELAHAHLKQVQSIRGTVEEHEAAAKDAIGDLTVYLLGVMSHHQVRPISPPVDSVIHRYRALTTDSLLLRLAESVGSLAAGQVGGAGRWIGSDVNRIVALCTLYCQNRGWDYATIVRDTWEGVRRRDWIAYPGTGLPPAAA